MLSEFFMCSIIALLLLGSCSYIIGVNYMGGDKLFRDHAQHNHKSELDELVDDDHPFDHKDLLLNLNK
jgi:hypothetical protein